jgi:hypothetical protein
MNTMTDANLFSSELQRLFSTPIGIVVLLLLALYGIICPPAPAPRPPARIALGVPRLVPMTQTEAASASRLLGSVAAEAMAQFEKDWS